MFNIFSYAEEVAVAIPVTQVGQVWDRWGVLSHIACGIIA